MTYDEFVEDRLAALSRYALMLTGDPHTAQDLVQETMVPAHLKRHRLVAADSPDQYVKRMLTNLLLDWRRGSWLRRVLLRPDAAETAVPHDHAERSADRDQVWQALATLPKQQRAAVVLRYYEDRADQEIADILGCSVGARSRDTSPRPWPRCALGPPIRRSSASTESRSTCPGSTRSPSPHNYAVSTGPT